MTVITDNKDLQKLCKTLSTAEFITIDTEFLRERTYYPKLCLIQVAGPDAEPYAIDPLAKGLDMAPVYELMENEKVLKVFHAARQDLEIFYNLTGKVPTPVFDTQVAAMVCGFGESIGYNNLVARICDAHIDKGAQFTDWSRRPLTKKQLSYALADVTYLRDVYLELSQELDKEKRTEWVKEEMKILTSAETYQNPPELAWLRIKVKTRERKVLAVLKEVAAWREKEAQRRDVPRNRVLRDETMVDIAVHTPQNGDDLQRIRNIPGDMIRGKHADSLMKAIAKGLKTPKEDCPQLDKKERFPSDLVPVLEMLKMLLRIQASEHDVAAKLIANTSDLELLALNDKADIPVLKGWRYKVFGKEALALKQGKITLGLENNRICKKTV